MKTYTSTIKQWAAEDRPREKLMNQGVRSLSNTELLAILIRSGTRNTTALELARQILKMANDNLQNLGTLEMKELNSVKGMGEAKSVSLLAALELGRRRKQAEVPLQQAFRSSKEVFDYMQPLLGDLKHEEFWVLYLNRSNRIMEIRKISQGGTAGTVIDVKIILKHAIEKLCSSLILCHNHPSGNLKPSEADIHITRKLKNAAEFMDIQLLDHLIVTTTGSYSFADEGMI